MMTLIVGANAILKMRNEPSLNPKSGGGGEGMIKIDRSKIGDLLKLLKDKRRELDNHSSKLTMPIAVDIDDLIWLIENNLLRRESVENKD